MIHQLSKEKVMFDDANPYQKSLKFVFANKGSSINNVTQFWSICESPYLMIVILLSTKPSQNPWNLLTTVAVMSLMDGPEVL